jgi:hypothetical protein
LLFRLRSIRALTARSLSTTSAWSAQPKKLVKSSTQVTRSIDIIVRFKFCFSLLTRNKFENISGQFTLTVPTTAPATTTTTAGGPAATTTKVHIIYLFILCLKNAFFINVANLSRARLLVAPQRLPVRTRRKLRSPSVPRFSPLPHWSKHY